MNESTSPSSQRRSRFSSKWSKVRHSVNDSQSAVTDMSNPLLRLGRKRASGTGGGVGFMTAVRELRRGARPSARTAPGESLHEAPLPDAEDVPGKALLRISRGKLCLELVDLLHTHVAPLTHLHVFDVRYCAATQEVVEAGIDVLGEVDSARGLRDATIGE